jgi:hypothetical protein
VDINVGNDTVDAASVVIMIAIGCRKGSCNVLANCGGSVLLDSCACWGTVDR